MLETKLYKLYDSPCSIKDASAKEGIVTGYLACFGNVDSDRDVIVKGAFAKTIAELGPQSPQPRIKHLLDHNTRQAIGRFTVLKEDDKGLYYESKIGSHELGVDFLKMCESGIITEHSIGYRIVKSQSTEVPNQGMIYQLLEIKLYEGSSLQFWGSNPNTPLTGIKSEQDWIDYFQNLQKALQTGTFTDATFQRIQSLHDELGTLLKNRTTQPDGKPRTTEPDGPQFDFSSLIKSQLTFQ